MSSPPQRATPRSTRPASRSVTALTTSRPPGASASKACRAAPAIARAAADEHRVGLRQAGQAPRARALDDSQAGTPSAAALRRDARGALGSRSIATARLAGSASIHSMAIEPEPAPTSHSSSPRRGASADSVIARISRLVIWPSCSNQSSGRPGARGRTRAPRSATTSSAIVFERGDVVEREVLRRAPRAALARAAHRLADGRAASRPGRARPAARQLGRRRAVPRQRQNARAGLQMRDDRFERAAVQREQRAILQAPAEPRRGEAKADGAGRQIISSAREVAHRACEPTPKKNGSPLASTQTGSPRRARMRGKASSIGDGQASRLGRRRSPPAPDGARRRRPARLAR